MKTINFKTLAINALIIIALAAAWLFMASKAIA
jgi:hypothetical protein